MVVEVEVVMKFWEEQGKGGKNSCGIVVTFGDISRREKREEEEGGKETLEAIVAVAAGGLLLPAHVAVVLGLFVFGAEGEVDVEDALGALNELGGVVLEEVFEVLSTAALVDLDGEGVLALLDHLLSDLEYALNGVERHVDESLVLFLQQVAERGQDVHLDELEDLARVRARDCICEAPGRFALNIAALIGVIQQVKDRGDETSVHGGLDLIHVSCQNV